LDLSTKTRLTDPGGSSAHPSEDAVVVTHAVRTPIGRFLGSLAGHTAADLGAHLVRALLERSGVSPRAVGEVVIGNARQAGGGPNVARQISVRALVPESVPAWTVNMACGSGLKAILAGADSIRLGRAEVVVAGGVESMSGLPFLLPRMREGYRLGHASVVDAMYQDGFLCPLSGMLMGETAEKLARELEISRDEQDRFALESQRKASAAAQSGAFASEIVAVPLKAKKGAPAVLERDEHVRGDANLAGLAKLPPVFDPEHGTVSAGNSSGITDGAAAVLLMSRAKARALGLEPLATLGASAQAAIDPSIMGLAPVPACQALRERNGLALDDYDLIELNEAFAAQVLACQRKMELPLERVNVNGGAIALGHPIGATGARIVVTLLHELARRGGERGLATLCISGGLGLAAAFHRGPI
jgi:acetyl-CoA C-acetyltransferase